MSVKKSRTAEDLKLDVLITDVRDSGNLPYTSGADCEAVGANCLQLNFFYRLTDHNCLVAGDCTAIDGVPLNLSTGHVPRIPCKNGTCKLITTVNTQIPGTITPGKEGNLEIRDVVIEDPSNNPFVKPGLFFP